MAQVDIRRLDMSLLLTLQSLLRTRRTTTTAIELGVTQSSVSHALSRLRDIFGDELFQRRSNGLTPTRRALELAPLVSQVIDIAHQAVVARPFEPGSAEGVVRIAALDHHCAVLASGFLERLEREAPGVKVSFHPLARKAASRAVVAGQVDIALGTFGEVSNQLEAIPLWQEPFVAVMAKNFAPSDGRMSLESFIAARHVTVSLDGELAGVVDEALAERGLKRNVVASLPYCMAAIAAVSSIDAVLTLNTRLARRHEEAFGLKVFKHPLSLRPFKVMALRTRRTMTDPLVGWCLDRLVEEAHASGPQATA